MQAAFMHILKSKLSPEQSRPSAVGEGFEHIRERFCNPTSQVTEHPPQNDQVLQPPSTDHKLILITLLLLL